MNDRIRLQPYDAPDPASIPRRNPTPTARDQVSDWAEMIKIEPALQRLFNEAAATRDDKRKRGFCANAHWDGSIFRSRYQQRRWDHWRGEFVD